MTIDKIDLVKDFMSLRDSVTVVESCGDWSGEIFKGSRMELLCWESEYDYYGLVSIMTHKAVIRGHIQGGVFRLESGNRWDDDGREVPIGKAL